MREGPQESHGGVQQDREQPGRCGPLAIERSRKADGRELIFYRRVREDDERAAHEQGEGESESRGGGAGEQGGRGDGG
jgi:hypothetical protein